MRSFPLKRAIFAGQNKEYSRRIQVLEEKGEGAAQEEAKSEEKADKKTESGTRPSTSGSRAEMSSKMSVLSTRSVALSAVTPMQDSWKEDWQKERNGLESKIEELLKAREKKEAELQEIHERCTLLEEQLYQSNVSCDHSLCTDNQTSASALPLVSGFA